MNRILLISLVLIGLLSAVVGLQRFASKSVTVASPSPVQTAAVTASPSATSQVTKSTPLPSLIKNQVVLSTGICGTTTYYSGLRVVNGKALGEGQYQGGPTSMKIAIYKGSAKIAETKSNADGTFSISLPPGTYTAVYSDYDIKKEITVAATGCTKVELDVRAP